jgi:hypothetical protein
MPDSPTVFALLVAAGLLAGWVDAVVGGGGVDPTAPRCSSGSRAPRRPNCWPPTRSPSICGTSVSAATYYRRVRPDLRTALPMAGAAYVGAIVGALIGLHIPKSAFNPVILALLVVVGAYTLLRPHLGTVTELRHSGTRHTSYAVLVGLVIGAYDGALGPGTGSFLVFALVGWLGVRVPAGQREGQDRELRHQSRGADGVRAAGPGAVGDGTGDGCGEPGRRLPWCAHGRAAGKWFRACGVHGGGRRLHRAPRWLGLRGVAVEMTVRALSPGRIGGAGRKDDRASAISVGKRGIDRGRRGGVGAW